MATPKKATTRSTRTRKEVKDDFEALEEAHAQAPVADPKTAALAKQRAEAVQAKTAAVTPETIVEQISQVGLEIQRTLADVQTQLLREWNELTELREAKAAEKAEVAQLHQIDVALAAIDVLVQEHAEKAAALEKDYAERAAHLDRTHEARLAEEAQAAADDAAARERDEAEHAYKTKLARRKAEDEFAQKQQLVERQLTERREAIEKGWADREATLKLAEKELLDLRATVAGVDARIKSEKDAAVAIATNSLKKDLVATFALERKDLEQHIALGRQSAAAFQGQNEALTKRIAQLEAELDKARDSVKEMAVASFKEAGTSRALAEVTSFGGRETTNNARKS